MPRKIQLDTSKSTGRPLQPMETNGATPPQEGQTTIASLIAEKQGALTSKAAPKVQEPSHQTHGAIFPAKGPITSVAQLLGRSSANGSISSFNTIQDYSVYLKSLSGDELHRHAVEEAKIVPIDDRSRLIRRLEGEYSTIASKAPGRIPNAPKIAGYNGKQAEDMEKLRRQILRTI